MADILVRRLDDAVKQRLKERAERHGRSLEAEVREILVEAAHSDQTTQSASASAKGFGTQMAEIFQGIGLTPQELAEFDEAVRNARKESDRDPPDFGE
ncbi:MAG: Arc family DNA-binding protein [Hyphomicrobiaceae bacterium]|nr:Arc family DNA-binding protein [Hyphomicrobiaceae bacterium]